MPKARHSNGKEFGCDGYEFLVWVSPKEILAGAKISLSATLPVAKNSLTSDVTGPISGGSGFADSYYQPFILAWETKSAAIRAAYGFLAPTGSFDATANDNVGSGYWTHVVSSGQTFYLTADKATAVSVFQMYEFHTTQEGTNIHPGQNLDLDYSVTQTIPAGKDVRVQVGLVGYGAWQTTDKSGPAMTPSRRAITTRSMRWASRPMWSCLPETKRRLQVLSGVFKPVDVSGALDSDFGLDQVLAFMGEGGLKGRERKLQ